MQLTEGMQLVLYADPSVTLLTSRGSGSMGERDCVEEGILIYLALWFSLESPPGMEKENVYFIFCVAWQGLWRAVSSWPLIGLLCTYLLFLPKKNLAALPNLILVSAPLE